MNNEAFQSLVVARTLFDQASVLMYADNKFSSSAALVILQDAFELVMRAALLELGLDETKNIERSSFDELISHLKECSVNVPKSGTLKAMNKSRVTVKHHGQLAEHDTVKNFVAATSQATELIMTSVFRLHLTDVFPGGQIRDEESRSLINEARQHISERDGYEALLSIRKAIFLAVEADYDVSSYKDKDRDASEWSFLSNMRGMNSPWHTKTVEYIEKHVFEPFDYIQFNLEKLKIDLMEWGVVPQDFWNIIRLTPAVFRGYKETIWHISTIAGDEDNQRDLENARYCFDRAVNILQKKQLHRDITRTLPWANSTFEIEIISSTPKLTKAHMGAPTRGQASVGEKFVFNKILSGLDGELYFKFFEADTFFTFYLLAAHCRQLGLAQS